MSAREKRLLWSAIIVTTIALAGLVWASAQIKVGPSAFGLDAPLTLASPTSQKGAALHIDQRSRLTRQPEALKLGRALGQRLTGRKRMNSVIVGTLIVGNDQQGVRIFRRQDEDGESIEVLINNGAPLTWSATAAAKSNGNPISNDKRLLIERLALDSPDQFVLAQLRNASYYTVGRNVRPAEAEGSDDYAGPVWNIVRVSEPDANAPGETQSRWRLYYVNTATGLIDRVVSQEQGETVAAEFSRWAEVNGEKYPTRIVWRKQGQVVMQLNLSNFAHSHQ